VAQILSEIAVGARISNSTWDVQTRVGIGAGRSSSGTNSSPTTGDAHTVGEYSVHGVCTYCGAVHEPQGEHSRSETCVLLTLTYSRGPVLSAEELDPLADGPLDAISSGTHS